MEKPGERGAYSSLLATVKPMKLGADVPRSSALRLLFEGYLKEDCKKRKKSCGIIFRLFMYMLENED
jgi:hypothetical protein